jgi:crossover junction endodeoxyribonuclease RusA
MTVGKAGKFYIQSVQAAVLISGCRRNLLGELQVSILAFPPDLRRRDLDNTLKATLDSLQKCGVYEDDFQIARLTIERCRPSKPGRLEVSILEV